MLVLKNAVTRPFWSSIHSYILNRMKRCISHKITSKVWRIDSGSRSKIYYVCDDNGWPTSWLYLTRRKNWKAWEVTQVWTFPEHRGKGLAESLYKAAVNADNILLASGNLHTQYSQAMWRRFIARKVFDVWAQDFRNLKRTSTVEIDDDELICDLEIYQPAKMHGQRKTDVRLIAMKRKQQ